MERRRYGSMGPDLSIVGFGGIIVMNEPISLACRIVDKAIDRGINYFDVAPTYGNAEETLGQALKPYRNSIFLACKTAKRTRKESFEELHNSLKRLQTDYLDLYQLHAVKTMEEVNQIMSGDGAIQTLIQAREEGLIKYTGFSAHSEEAALELLDRFRFDSVLFPLNLVCWFQENFGPKVVKKAQEKGVTILAIKSLAKRRLKKDEIKKWPKCWYAPVEDPEEASLFLRFTLSLPVTSAVSPSHAELLWWMCDTAESFIALTDEEEAELPRRSKGLEPIFPQN
ncbi:MAG: aldo/keto reductase [Candidatus Bathyarchaeia archaeon]|nr:aldo/keto reductase [Candidatus Bathyarchaeota archaeon]